MTALNKQALREAAEKALPAMKRLLMMPNDELFDEALLNVDGDVDAANAFNLLAGPETMLALLDELEAKGQRFAELELRLSQQQSIAANNLDMFRRADARVAELEAREVKLPTVEGIHHLGPHSAKLFCYFKRSVINECADAIRAAGIGVKQQQDSVDSDVGSRNQPGMVVAVHIDAGDFVKVKGQVFEVEETDFDDHDVTLWFVGGNALKCAAGCQVEVVAAPVDAGIGVKGD